MNDQPLPPWTLHRRTCGCAVLLALVVPLGVVGEPALQGRELEVNSRAATQRDSPDGLPPMLQEVRYGPHDRNGLKEMADAVGLRCHLVRRGESESTVSIREFVEDLFMQSGLAKVLPHEPGVARRAEALNN